MFLIISPQDKVVYQLYTNLIKREITFIHELISFASLDLVDVLEQNKESMYVKSVDKFNENIVSAFVTAGKMRFLLMHEGKNDDNIKNFFQEVYEYYCKALLNPFIDKESKIFSSSFDIKIKYSLKKHLN